MSLRKIRFSFEKPGLVKNAIKKERSTSHWLPVFYCAKSKYIMIFYVKDLDIEHCNCCREQRRNLVFSYSRLSSSSLSLGPRFFFRADCCSSVKDLMINGKMPVLESDILWPDD